MVGRALHIRQVSWVTAAAWTWVAAVVFGAVFASLLAPQGSDDQNVLAALQGPSLQHILGTDPLGRGLLVRLLYGARPTLEGAAILVALTVCIGGASGLAGGYLGGRADRALALISDIAQSVPGLLVGLVVFAIFPGNLDLVMAVTGLFMSAPMYRIVRGATLTVRNELYVTAARASGLSHAAIIRRHLAPRLARVIRVQASMMAALAIVIEIGYGFLGLDVPSPDPSWGGILANASQYLSTDTWMIVPPIVVTGLTILAFGVLGEVVERPARRRRRRTPSRRPLGTAQPRSSKSAAATRAPADGLLAPDVFAEPSGVESAAEVPASTNPRVLLSVRNLSIETTGPRRLTLVDHVGFDVRRGEVLGLVGETGAGKSAVTRALVQPARNTRVQGSMIFDGVDLAGGDKRKLAAIRGRRIAYVGQDPMSALDPLFRVESQLVEAIRTHRDLSKREARAAALRLLASVRIPSPEIIARQYPFQISGGQAQRVAIALALAGDPELLIADEPTTALDVTVQMEVLGLLKELQRDRGLTILLVTHDWGVVADMCDRVLTLYVGEIVESGAVREVFKHPAHPYTAALRQADPHLQAEDGKLTFIPGAVPAPGKFPDGCRFAARCPLALDQCRAVHPQLADLEPEKGGHTSRCIRANELRRGAVHV